MTNLNTSAPLQNISLSIPKTFDNKKFFGWDKYILELFVRGMLLAGILAGVAVGSAFSALVISPFTSNDWVHGITLLVIAAAGVYCANKIGDRILERKEKEKKDYREKVAFPKIIAEFKKLGWTLDDFLVGALVNHQSMYVKDAHGAEYSFRYFTIFPEEIVVEAVLTDKTVLDKIKSERVLTQDEQDLEDFSQFIKSSGKDISRLSPNEIFLIGRHWKK